MTQSSPNLTQMSDQELRQYYRESRDIRAFEEIVKRGPNDKDKEVAQQFTTQTRS